MSAIDILVSLASIAMGGFFGILGNKLINTREKSNWKWAYYLFGGLVILFALGCIGANNVHDPHYKATIIIAILSIISGGLIIIGTKKLLLAKNIYSIPELNPIINEFTNIADRSEIKLFGGDLNFFGNSTSDIDRNIQYNHLKALRFSKVLILCEEPNSPETRIRYGKILAEIPHTSLGFYNPRLADLRVRGRLIRVDGSTKLLMYTKDKPGYYKAIETDTGNSNGALYNNIWELVWSLSYKPTAEENDSMIKMFSGGHRL